MMSVHKPLNAKLTLFAKLNYPALLLTRTTEQTAQCQSVGNSLQKCVRLFRYTDWLPRKSILKLAN